MKRHLTRTASAITGLLLVGACSSATKPSAAGASATPTQAGATASTSATAASSPASSDATTTQIAPGSTPTGGECKVTLTGGINETFSSPGSVSSVLVGYWLSDKEKSLISVAANSVPLIINCVSDIASVTIGGSDKLTTTIFPKGPSEFPLKASENALSITNGDSPLNALVQITKYKTNWTLKEDGYVKFTALDDNHIAGEFKFSLTDSLAKLGNTAPAPDTVVSGTFDYMNPKKG